MFTFDMKFSKAVEREGKKYVTAVASDTIEDEQDDFVSEAGIDSLVSCVKKGIVRGATDSHIASFPFAKIHDSAKVPIDPKSGHYEFWTELELDEKYPQSIDLYDAVAKGEDKFQLSIGGDLNTGNPECFTHVVKSGKKLRSLNDLVLDHIMVTAKNRAANSRTRFVSAITKSIDFDSVEKQLHTKLMDESIIYISEDTDTPKYSRITKSQAKALILKSSFKTCKDAYDGHIHIMDVADLDENGNGFTKESVGSHPRSENHKHEVKGYIVQEYEKAVDFGEESDAEDPYYGSEYDPNYVGSQFGKFISRHKDYMYDGGISYLVVGKEKPPEIQKEKKKESTAFEIFKSIPKEAFALPELKRLKHHFNSVKDSNELKSVDIKSLKKSLDYVNSDKFLEGEKDKNKVEELRKEAKEHLEKHLSDFNKVIEKNLKPKKGRIRKFISKFTIRKDNSMKLSKEDMKKLGEGLVSLSQTSDDVEFTEETAELYLKSYNGLKEMGEELGLLGPDEPKVDEKPVVAAKVEATPVPVATPEKELVSASAEKSTSFDFQKMLKEGFDSLKSDFRKELDSINAKLEKSNVKPEKVEKDVNSIDIDDLFGKLGEEDESKEDENISNADFFSFIDGPVNLAVGNRAFGRNKKR